MEYKIEELSPIKRKVTVDAPVEETNAALATAVALIKRSADIPGFRKGKAPADLIEQRYRKKIYGEATTDLINAHINEIMSELRVTPLGRIDVDAKEIERDQPFSYNFSFEVAPQFELPEYKGLTIEQEEAEVKEEEVLAVIDKIRNNLAQLVPPMEARNPVDGDVATLSFQAFEGDTPIEGIKAESFELTLGQGQSLPEFEAIVKSLKPGESGQGDITFPEDFLNSALAGKTATMKVTLHAIKEKKLPEVDDEFAKKAGGFDSVDKLREAITKSYLDSRNQLNKAAAQKKTLDELLAKVEFPLPESMVEEHIDRMINELTGKLERQGRSLESLGKAPQELRDSFKPEAEELTRAHLFLLAVAAKEDLKIQPREIDFFLQQIATRTGQDLNSVKRFHEEAGLIPAIKDRILADKAMEIIYGSADVKKVPASDKAEASAGE